MMPLNVPRTTLCTAIVLCASLQTALASNFTPGDGTMGSDGMPHVPEPLLFDLVRPLGASRGELEVNVLVEHQLTTGRHEFAPEIEYALADGLALELELPFNGARLEEIKVAIQGTLGTLRQDRMVHGWQTIVRRDRHDGSYSGDLLYLNAAELGRRWSTLNMVGLRRTESGSKGRTQTLVNNSFFFERSPRMTVGMELNHEIDQRGNWRLRAVPQLHLDLEQRATLQVGLGPSRLEPGAPAIWALNWRLIGTF